MPLTRSGLPAKWKDQGNYTIRPITPSDRLSISFMRATLRLTVAIGFDLVGECNQLEVRR